DLWAGRAGWYGRLRGVAEPNQRVFEAPRIDALEAPPCPLRRKILKQRGHHPRGELFEQAHRSWRVPVAEMHQRKVLRAESPFWHDFDEAAVPHELGLQRRRR